MELSSIEPNDLEFNDLFLREITDITCALRNKKLFYGNVKGTMSIEYFNKVPYSYGKGHLNRRIIGITLEKIQEKRYEFIFECSSIFNFFVSLEYIRGYSKYRNAKICKINVSFNEISNDKISENLETKQYEKLLRNEIQDTIIGYEWNRVLSGSSTVEFLIIYKSNIPFTLSESEYSTIYQLLMKLEELRNSHPIDLMRIIITELDDNRVIPRD